MRDRRLELAGLEEQTSRLTDEGETLMYVAIDGQAAGIVAVADTVKPDSAAAIRVLTEMGLEVVMISGDNERTARAIAQQVGSERVLAPVLPQDKAFNVQRLQLDGKQVAVVGDGVLVPQVAGLFLLDWRLPLTAPGSSGSGAEGRHRE